MLLMPQTLALLPKDMMRSRSVLPQDYALAPGFTPGLEIGFSIGGNLDNKYGNSAQQKNVNPPSLVKDKSKGKPRHQQT